jgi:hypothetical protein
MTGGDHREVSIQRLNLIRRENQCALLAFTNGLVVGANGFLGSQVDGMEQGERKARHARMVGS